MRGLSPTRRKRGAPRVPGSRPGLRGLASLVLLGAWRAAWAFVQIPARLAPGLAAGLGSSLGAGAGLPALGGALVVAGAAALGYQLLHAGEGAPRQVLLSRQAAGGKPARLAVEVGGPHGEDVAGLAAAEGLPRPGVSAPLAGVSGPARPASGASASAAGALDTRYLQALALSTMVRIDDRPDASAGWPVASYCRAGVHALQCHHDDVWIRNRSSVDLRDVSICVAPAARAYFQIAGAGSDGCLHAELAAHADRQIDVVEAPTPRARYPGFHELELDLSQDAWHPGVVLHRLWLPVMRPQTFFALHKPTPQDEQHAIGVQARRVNLLQQLVVYTYHGSGESVARLRSVELDDAHKGFRLVPRASQPGPFEKYRVPECTSRAQPGPGQVHRLDSGMSCALLVSATDIHEAPYAGAAMRREKSPLLEPGSPFAEEPQDQESRGPDQREPSGRLDTDFQAQGRATTQAGIAQRVVLTASRWLLAGGDFTRAGRLGDMDYPVPHLLVVRGQEFLQPRGLMLGPNARVDAIDVSYGGRRLFIGGRFQPLEAWTGQDLSSGLAATHGESWSFWNRNNGPNGEVDALAATPQGMYVGGNFTQVAGVPSPGIASLREPAPDRLLLEPGLWQGLGGGLHVYTTALSRQYPGLVRSILPIRGGKVLVGGVFGFNSDARDPRRLARIPDHSFGNLAVWNELSRSWAGRGLLIGGEGMGRYDAGVDALAVYGERMYAGGNFDWVGRGADLVHHLDAVHGWAAYYPDESPAWRPVGDNVYSDVRSLAATPQGLYAGGMFDDPYLRERSPLVLWDGQSLRGLHHPLIVSPHNPPHHAQATVDALRWKEDSLAVGGSFTALADGAAASNLAVYDAADGSVGTFGGKGVNRKVRTLAWIWAVTARQAP